MAASLALALLAPMGARAAEAKKEKPSYLRLTTLAATINQPGGRRGVMTIEIGIDTPDPALRDKVELVQPVLRDAYVTVLQPYALSITPGSPPSADYIAMTLQRATDRVMGRKGARLLIGSILIN